MNTEAREQAWLVSDWNGPEDDDTDGCDPDHLEESFKDGWNRGDSHGWQEAIRALEQHLGALDWRDAWRPGVASALILLQEKAPKETT